MPYKKKNNLFSIRSLSLETVLFGHSLASSLRLGSNRRVVCIGWKLEDLEFHGQVEDVLAHIVLHEVDAVAGWRFPVFLDESDRPEWIAPHSLCFKVRPVLLVSALDPGLELSVMLLGGILVVKLDERKRCDVGDAIRSKNGIRLLAWKWRTAVQRVEVMRGRWWKAYSIACTRYQSRMALVVELIGSIGEEETRVLDELDQARSWEEEVEWTGVDLQFNYKDLIALFHAKNAMLCTPRREFT